MDSHTKEKITAELAAIILDIAPDAGFVAKYGGTLVELAAGNPKTQFCGYFAYKAHISLEFSKGFELDDPEGLLEGKGKYRRHIKLRRLEDITHKRCREFLEQASRL